MYKRQILIEEASDKKLLANRVQSEKRLIDKVHGKTVLLHIFNTTSEVLVTRQLKRWGMKVETLVDPEKINESIKDLSKVDYVILGFRPRFLNKNANASLSGIQMAFKLRELEAFSETPIILYSSYSKQFLLDEIGDNINPVTHFICLLYTSPSPRDA